MNFGEVLGKAWKIVWRHKVLWIFGILASCSAARGNPASSSRGQTNLSSGNLNGQLPAIAQEYLDKVTRFFESIPAWVWVGVACLALLWILVVMFLSTMGKIGLIKGTILADTGTPVLSLGSVFSASLPYFWRVFFLHLLVGVAIFILVLAMFVPLIMLTAATLGLAIFCILPFLCLLIPLGWVLNTVIEQSDIAIVDENLGIFAGLERGWKVFTANFGPIIVMALILGVGGWIAGMLIALPMLAIIFPPILGIVAGTKEAFQATMLLSLAMFCVYLPVFLVASGILYAYISAAWTLTFRRLTGKGLPALEVPPPTADLPAPV